MTIRHSAPRAKDLRDWMICHVAALTDAGAAAWHVLRAQMIAAGFDAFLEESQAGRAILRDEFPGVTLNAAAAADVVIENAIAALADELVADLFSNGSGRQAARLALVDDDGKTFAGWGPAAVRDRIVGALRRAPPASAVLEAIQDEEAIERLALALRATSQWFTSTASAPMIMWKLAEFLENPDYARSAINAGGGKPRS